MNPLEEHVQTELEKLQQLLGEHPTIQRFKEIDARVQTNEKLTLLEEQMKQAQKNAVNFAHYGKPEAEKATLKELAELQQAYNQHPQVVAYRQRLYDANELLHYVTSTIQQKVNEQIQEGTHASKNEAHTHDGTIFNN
ncbi:MAG: YlbF family regulator [Enterococcus sp.]